MTPPINPLMHHFLGITQHPTGQGGFGSDPLHHLPSTGSSFGGPVLGGPWGGTPPRRTVPTRPLIRGGPMPPIGPQRSNFGGGII